MKKLYSIIPAAVVVAVLLQVTAEAQILAPNRPAARNGRGTQQQGSNGRDQQNFANDPNKRTDQQARTANAIETLYVGLFQNQVGLNDEQLVRTSPLLGAYIRQQLMRVDRKTNMRAVLESMINQNASADAIQEQVRLLDQVDVQLQNQERKFLADIDPLLSVMQRAKLRVFLYQTAQRIQRRTQESAQ